ncbi:pyruvate dehydrogenase E2 component (dihydrolipoamide acetyltransferase)/2-oxoglutarate dehydrogenase E2 component (dihydrolipoamide succinyltransferase) [Jannaschia faecimaris]|uniref:Pyruvate dehydrogenase E2 component (Dihydrolipoamide acetyltransferase)/2-oxoglutarate dehydrogenase E2 component (Dihydrolipoamide succinyltransferase) n=1 Tax=Jannaschia faecimaris TaxID=1244108 RepID=A0A1H3ST59_9RHOB|nr:biotin/lipoyl-containing protein [Jannaschia faecimaris]SDZ40868.1 pyruvate dehydrogenase E2 component (dihydrolipoamide acetyltransferase)/2-oxoglutarate dehydrogenase E2 component (dihydrolipoamide succinyltransferase) [Jannaschia faecimaris]
MPLDVIMPALGMAQETGQIVAWHKQPGDAVSKGEVLFEVETDKATMEVEAQGDGYLTDVTASEGTDVPVGHVIAQISDTAESAQGGESPPPAPAEDTEALPEGKDVIMPTLGMAQDTGLLVTWHKAAGDAVGADDVLFEVETDKSTVEVNAGVDGFVAALLAEEGEEVPVGQTIAIISAQAPANPVTRRASSAATSTEPPKAPAKPEAKAPPAAKAGTDKAAPPSAAGGRILASPKLRRLAREQGLDLARLAETGLPQPFHVKDLEALKAMPAATAAGTGGGPAACRLKAKVKAEGFSAFATWAAENARMTDTPALLAGLCAASLGKNAIVAVETFGESKTYAAATQLGKTEASDDAPQLRLRDLRFTPITTVNVGGEDIPTLTLTRRGKGLAITLEYAAGQFDASDAITLLSSFAGRMEQPLRHLL